MPLSIPMLAATVGAGALIGSGEKAEPLQFTPNDQGRLLPWIAPLTLGQLNQCVTFLLK